MKAIKINTTVNLSTGQKLSSGSVVIIAEGYADVKSQKDNLIPAQVATFTFINEAAVNVKEPVSNMVDYSPVFSGLSLTVSAFETSPAETLLIDAVYNALDSIYPGKVEVIEIVNNENA